MLWKFEKKKKKKKLERKTKTHTMNTNWKTGFLKHCPIPMVVPVAAT